jgi:hypothetical protein
VRWRSFGMSGLVSAIQDSVLNVYLAAGGCDGRVLVLGAVLLLFGVLVRGDNDASDVTIIFVVFVPILLAYA